jgi:hypothetical protein
VSNPIGINTLTVVVKLFEIKLVISKSDKTAELSARILSIATRAAASAAVFDAIIAVSFAKGTLLPVAVPDADALNEYGIP